MIHTLCVAVARKNGWDRGEQGLMLGFAFSLTPCFSATHTRGCPNSCAQMLQARTPVQRTTRGCRPGKWKGGVPFSVFASTYRIPSRRMRQTGAHAFKRAGAPQRAAGQVREWQIESTVLRRAFPVLAIGVKQLFDVHVLCTPPRPLVQLL